MSKDISDNLISVPSLVIMISADVMIIVNINLQPLVTRSAPRSAIRINYSISLWSCDNARKNILKILHR